LDEFVRCHAAQYRAKKTPPQGRGQFAAMGSMSSLVRLWYYAMLFLPIHFRNSLELSRSDAECDHAYCQCIACDCVAFPVVLFFLDSSNSANSSHALALVRLYPISFRLYDLRRFIAANASHVPTSSASRSSWRLICNSSLAHSMVMQRLQNQRVMRTELRRKRYSCTPVSSKIPLVQFL
jgi:hypothetical protein